MAAGRKGCFVVLLTREFALRTSLDRVNLGLIWLRHARARMGHQVVASPTVRYILRGERNRSVAVNSLSLIEIWETCTLLLKHPPTSRARTPLARGREERGWKNEAALPPPRRQGGNLEGLKTGKRQLSRRQRLKYLQALEFGKKGMEGGHKLSANRSRTQSGAVKVIAERGLLPPTARGPAPSLPV